MTTAHTLKSWPKFFQPLLEAVKQFEVRNNDRNYAVGDILIIKEWDNRSEMFTGREVIRRVTYILHLGSVPFAGLMHSGYVVLGLEKL